MQRSEAKRTRAGLARRLLIVGGGAALLTGCLGDGYTLVGPASNEFHRGVVYTTYLTNHDGCLWQPMTSTAKNGRVVGGGVFLDGNPGRVFMQVPPAATVVKSEGCLTWVPARPTSYNADRTQAGAGMYRIPNDLEPGSYSAAPAFTDRPCVVSVLANWYGNDTGATGYNSTVTVTLKTTDVGFVSWDCTTWQRVGG